MNPDEELQIRRVMIDLMADKLTTDYHSRDWVIKYYREMAKRLIEQDRRRKGNVSND